MPIYFSGFIKALLFARLAIRTISTYRKSGRLFILRVMACFQSLLAQISATSIAKKVGVSRWYSGRIREDYCPHPMHWQALAQLVRASADV
jgi:hypothetical protein